MTIHGDEPQGSYQRSKFTTTTGKSVELRKPEREVKTITIFEQWLQC